MAAAQSLPWDLPLPTMRLDAQWRITDVNPAFEAYVAMPRQQLLFQDPITLLSASDQVAERQARPRWRSELDRGRDLTVEGRQLVDGDGRTRWFRTLLSPLRDDPQRHVLVVLHDEGAGQIEAERARRELAQWFDLSNSGMLVFDSHGNVERANHALVQMLGQVPASIASAAADFQALVGWQDGRAPASPREAQDRQAIVVTPRGKRRLRARMVSHVGVDGSSGALAIVDDLSVEDERDLAQLERGALMDTAGIGVATYDSLRGWLQPSPSDSHVTTLSAATLQNIGRDIVEPASLPEYERLQSALRAGERAEVRYAVRHPELGQRWLLTRIEPSALASGRRTTSVVTLDVTETERASQRNEQLLRELTTILEGSSAGMAYLNDGVIVRCNSRFARLLAGDAGNVAGTSLATAFAASAVSAPVVQAAQAAIDAGREFDAELVFDDGRDTPHWYSLSVRSALATSGAGGGKEAVAVLTDISALKKEQAELEALLQDRELMFGLSEVGIVFQRGARIQRANPAMAALSGYPAPELTTLDSAALYESARVCVEFETRMNAALTTEGRFVGERRLRRRDGNLRWVQVGARRVRVDQPEAGLICSFVDVDELHRARESLVRQADRTRAILDSVLVGIVTVTDGTIEWMNRSARRMFGGELADFVGESISIVATPQADHPLRRTDYVDRLSEGQAETFECRLRGRDGREFWVVGNAVVTARDARADQLTFALLDIEQRRQAEVTITQARSSLQRVIDTAPIAIALLDAIDRRELQGNRLAAHFLAHPPEGLREALYGAALAGAEPAVHELRQRTRHGDRLWDTRLVHLPATPGAAAQLLVVASDVTEQREAERARLQDAIDQRELLVKEVHHRIKNNLQGVAGMLQLHAERHPQVAATLGDAVAQVHANAQVYGLQVGGGGLLRIARVAQAIAHSVQRTFGKPIRFLMASADADTFVLPEAESIPIALALNELFTNSVKHGNAEGTRCVVSVDGDNVIIEMRQRGRLPEGFDVDSIKSGVSGLGLVRALLPRRSSQLTLSDDGVDVTTCLTLRAPSVRRETIEPHG